MLTSGRPTPPTAISEQAEMHPEFPSIFWFEPITNISLARKQATLIAGKPLRLSSQTTTAITNCLCSFKSIAIQTDIQTDDCSLSLLLSIQIQTNNCSCLSFNNDCSLSPSLISQIQIHLPLHLTAITEATAFNNLTATAPSSTVAGPP
jgi:hypothetical protein